MQWRSACLCNDRSALLVMVRRRSAQALTKVEERVGQDGWRDNVKRQPFLVLRLLCVDREASAAGKVAESHAPIHYDVWVHLSWVRENSARPLFLRMRRLLGEGRAGVLGVQPGAATGMANIAAEQKSWGLVVDLPLASEVTMCCQQFNRVGRAKGAQRGGVALKGGGVAWISAQYHVARSEPRARCQLQEHGPKRKRRRKLECRLLSHRSTTMRAMYSLLLKTTMPRMQRGTACLARATNGTRTEHCARRKRMKVTALKPSCVRTVKTTIVLTRRTGGAIGTSRRRL